MNDWKARLRRWVKRYGPPEIFGTLTALLAYAVTDALTGNSIAAAYAGSLGENLGFYGTFMLRSIARGERRDGAGKGPYASRRVWRQAHRATRQVVVEFGLAEVLDTFAVRPLAMGLATSALGPHAGVPVGKVAADAVFYAVTIVGYELRRRAHARG